MYKYNAYINTKTIHSLISVRYIPLYKYYAYIITSTIHPFISVQFIPQYWYNVYLIKGTIQTSVPVQYIAHLQYNTYLSTSTSCCCPTDFITAETKYSLSNTWHIIYTPGITFSQQKENNISSNTVVGQCISGHFVVRIFYFDQYKYILFYFNQ